MNYYCYFLILSTWKVINVLKNIYAAVVFGKNIYFGEKLMYGKNL